MVSLFITGAIKSSESDTVRQILLKEKGLISQKFKCEDAKFDSSIELDAYKFLGAYIGAITPLQYAILLGQDDIAKDIIERSFKDDLNQTFGGGNTALHLATLLGATTLVKLLVERGADLLLTNSKGFTAVDISDDPEMRKILSNSNK